MKVNRRSRGIAPPILNLGARWSLVPDSFTEGKQYRYVPVYINCDLGVSDFTCTFLQTTYELALSAAIVKKKIGTRPH